jgi:hypothetical protein
MPPLCTAQGHTHFTPKHQTRYKTHMNSCIQKWVACLAVGLSPLPAWTLELSDVAREGELRFLAERPDPGAYHYQSQVTISPESLRSGVVSLNTCHRALDPNARIVIQFNPERVQTIRIVEFQGMADAQVQGHRVELRDVQRGASICIDLRSRVLDEQSPGQWRLRAGPLMRRYLDGYLPMQAQLQVKWPEGLLQVASQEPANQAGADLQARSDGATWQLIFAGRLNTHMVLQQP